MTVTTLPRGIIGGVDTHLDVHVAAALDDRGALLGVESFATTERGYKLLLGWLSDFGPVELVGVEGTGSYGAGLTRHLHDERVRVVEVDRPNRQRRRLKGKSDPQDAISAARAALSGEARGEAKTRDGNVESMRVLRVARFSARKGRTQALNQMRNLVSTAPEPIRAELRGLSVFHLLERASAYRPGTKRDIVSLTKFTLRMLARRPSPSKRRSPSSTPSSNPWSKKPRPNWSPLSASGPMPLRHSSSSPATIRQTAQRGGLRPPLRRLTARCE
jgi:transposase